MQQVSEIRKALGFFIIILPMLFVIGFVAATQGLLVAAAVTIGVFVFIPISIYCIQSGIDMMDGNT